MPNRPSEFRRADEIFDAALDLAPEARAAFVERACSGDPPLRDRVTRLLRAHDRSEAFLAEPVAGLAAPRLPAGGHADGGDAIVRLQRAIGDAYVV
jgi:hypothetical protein